MTIIVILAFSFGVFVFGIVVGVNIAEVFGTKGTKP